MKSTSLPDEILNTLQSEEDLVQAMDEYQVSKLFNDNDEVFDTENLDTSAECEQCTNKIPISAMPLCGLCSRSKNLVETRNDYYERQKKEATKMITFSEELYPQLEIDDSITLSVPKVDRGPLDFSQIHGVIVNRENDIYQIGTEDCLIKGWFPRTDLVKSGTRILTVQDVNTDLSLSLREAAAKQSLLGG